MKILKFFSSIAILLFFSLNVSAQKEFKAIKTALKSLKSEEALASIQKLEKDSTFMFNPQLYQYGVSAYKQLNDTENEKIYLKQNSDTTKFFSSIYGIFEYALKTDKAERHNRDSNNAKFKYRKGNKQILNDNYPNLNTAVKYFFHKKSYDEAQRYAAMSIESSHDSIWEGIRPAAVTDSALIENALCYLGASYAKKDYTEVSRYKDLALKDSMRHAKTFEYITLSALQLGDTLAYYKLSKEGLKQHPKEMFFYKHTADYLFHQGKYADALNLSDSLLVNDPDNPTLLDGKAIVLYNMQRDEECIVAAQQLLEVDTLHPRAHFYIGSSYCRMAGKILLPTNINSKEYKKAYTQKKELYAKALPEMEKYKALAPNDYELWAPSLYEIYLNLNKGKEFEEINDYIIRNNLLFSLKK